MPLKIVYFCICSSRTFFFQGLHIILVEPVSHLTHILDVRGAMFRYVSIPQEITLKIFMALLNCVMENLSESRTDFMVQPLQKYRGTRSFQQ